MTAFRMSKKTIHKYFSSSSASTPHTNEKDINVRGIEVPDMDKEINVRETS